MLFLDEQWLKESALRPSNFVCPFCKGELSYPLIMTLDCHHSSYHAKCASVLLSDLSRNVSEFTIRLLKTRASKKGLRSSNFVCSFCELLEVESSLTVTLDDNHRIYHARCAIALEAYLASDIAHLTGVLLASPAERELWLHQHL